MAAERLQDFIRLDIQTAASLFAPVCPSIQVQGLTPCRDSMSNSGYEVATNHGKYFLKLYSNNADSIETAAYSFLAGKIPVPRLYYYDGEQTRFPYPYAVLEFLEGCTLHQAIRDTGEFSPNSPPNRQNVRGDAPDPVFSRRNAGRESGGRRADSGYPGKDPVPAEREAWLAPGAGHGAQNGKIYPGKHRAF